MDTFEARTKIFLGDLGEKYIACFELCFLFLGQRLVRVNLSVSAANPLEHRMLSSAEAALTVGW